MGDSSLCETPGRRGSRVRYSDRPEPARLREVVFILALSLAVMPCVAAELSGRIVGVLDGDTIELVTPARQQIRVRLAGIDAPERKQAFGAVAKRKLSDFVFARDVTVESRKRDRYGRTVGAVFVDGTDVGLKMIEIGMAWHLEQYATEQSPADCERYAVAEQEARAKRLGLWRDANPVPPWEFRRSIGPRSGTMRRSVPCR